jgi:glycosyltransferase involved in cell wall biosynthesis
VTPVPPVGVRWISPSPGDGFGDASQQYLLALESLGVPVTWTPLEWLPGTPEPRAVATYHGPMGHLAHRAIEHDTVAVHYPPDRGRRWLEETSGRRAVALTTWETDRVPFGWAQHIEAFDAVLVPSTFNRGTLLASGCRAAVHVVPYCARPHQAVEPARYERIGDRFLFYTIGTWSSRKAMADTVTAFLDAFGANEDVALVVKTSPFDQQEVARARRGHGAHTSRKWAQATWPAFAALLAGRKNVPEIFLIADNIPATAVDALHARGDCFLSLTRAEGWGLCIADALLFGNPVVVTGWGGQLDYLGADYPLLVDYDLVPTTTDPSDDWFEAREEYQWARARHDHAVELLRWVASHREEASAIGRRAGARIAHEFSPERVGRQLLDALSVRSTRQ